MKSQDLEPPHKTVKGVFDIRQLSTPDFHYPCCKLIDLQLVGLARVLPLRLMRKRVILRTVVAEFRKLGRS